MLLAVIATLLSRQILSFELILAGVVAGALIGGVLAVRIEMTAMPQAGGAVQRLRGRCLGAGRRRRPRREQPVAGGSGGAVHGSHRGVRTDRGGDFLGQRRRLRQAPGADDGQPAAVSGAADSQRPPRGCVRSRRRLGRRRAVVAAGLLGPGRRCQPVGGRRRRRHRGRRHAGGHRPFSTPAPASPRRRPASCCRTTSSSSRGHLSAPRG